MHLVEEISALILDKKLKEGHVMVQTFKAKEFIYNIESLVVHGQPLTTLVLLGFHLLVGKIIAFQFLFQLKQLQHNLDGHKLPPQEQCMIFGELIM